MILFCIGNNFMKPLSLSSFSVRVSNHASVLKGHVLFQIYLLAAHHCPTEVIFSVKPPRGGNMDCQGAVHQMFKLQSFYSLRMARFRCVVLMPVNLKIFLSSAARVLAGRFYSTLSVSIQFLISFCLY